MRSHFFLFLSILLLLVLPAPSFGADYPRKNITLIVGYSAGGGTDTMARIFAAELEKTLGRRVLIINRPGADAQIATAQMAEARPDGYTLGMVTSLDFILGPIVARDVGYAIDDFIPIASFQQSANALTVKKGSPFKTLEDVVAHAKAHPGALSFSHSGTLHIALLTLLEAETGAAFNVVRFGGGGENLNAVLGGHVDGGIQDKRFLPQALEAGVTPLAISSPQRFSDMPDLRTFRECGYDIVQPVRRVLLAPKDTPSAIVNVLAAACRKIYADPAFIETLRKQAEEPSLLMGGDLRKELVSLYEYNKKLLTPRLDRLKR